MPVPDYSAPAEVYATPTRGAKRSMLYRKFTSLAEAVQFVVEDLPSGMMHALAETDDERFEGESLRALYDADSYPLPRAPGSRLQREAVR